MFRPTSSGSSGLTPCRSSAMAILLFALTLLSILPQCNAWGSLGHRTVAYLAEKYLTSDASVFVHNLLQDEDISDAALWPDEIRHRSGWTFTAGWHFIDAEDDPPRTCGVKLQRDCVPKSGCIVSAIANMTRRISDPELDDEQHYEALKFLLHFIGDIHQPLHTEAEQRGGNGIPVLFNKRHTNLHSIWDNEILEKHAGGPKADEREDARQWADNLYTALPDDDGGIAPLAECANLGRAADCALQWASEANRYVCSYVLKDDVAGLEGKNLAEDYYDGAVPIVDYLIAKAGLRLATWINAIARVQARSTTSLVKDPAQIPIHPRT